MTTPGKVRFSPYISASSGRPFNITTGRDYYGDSLNTDRPSLAAPGTPGAIVTQWGVFQPNPGPNDPRIARNFAEGPGLCLDQPAHEPHVGLRSERAAAATQHSAAAIPAAARR